MDLEFLKIIATIVGSGTGIYGLFWVIRKIYEIHVIGKRREITIKRGVGGDYDLNAKNLTENEIMNLVKQLSIKDVKNSSLQLIKTEKNK